LFKLPDTLPATLRHLPSWIATSREPYRARLLGRPQQLYAIQTFALAPQNPLSSKSFHPPHQANLAAYASDCMAAGSRFLIVSPMG